MIFRQIKIVQKYVSLICMSQGQFDSINIKYELKYDRKCHLLRNSVCLCTIYSLCKYLLNTCNTSVAFYILEAGGQH